MIDRCRSNNTHASNYYSILPLPLLAFSFMSKGPNYFSKQALTRLGYGVQIEQQRPSSILTL